MSPEYIAGFFDADGSVGIYNRGTPGAFQICVAIANSGKHGAIICKKLRTVFGGAVVYCTDPKKSTHRETFWFKINGNLAVEKFLLHIREHVIIKRDQIDLCLQFIALRRTLPRFCNPKQIAQLRKFVARCKAMKRAC